MDARFCPPVEKLAFPIINEGETDLPGIHADPLPELVEVLTYHSTWREVAENLPDIELEGDIGSL